jgi:tetratricopeptide (TPR) repeat protein
MIGRALAFFALLLAAAPLQAIEVQLNSSRSEVAPGEQFTVAVEVKDTGAGSLPRPDLPQVPGLQEMGEYESRNFSFVNGRMTGSLVVQHLFIADEAGTYTIGPATVEKDGQRVASGTITVQVRPGGSSSSPQSRGSAPSAPLQEGSLPSPNDDRDLFVIGEVDQSQPYVNEQITYTFTFLRRVQVFEGTRYSPPTTTGFWSEEIDTTDPTEVTIDGRRYVAERVRTALFPTGPGEFTIGEAKLTTTVAESRQRRRDPFDLFGGDPFGFFRSGREVQLKADPIRVRVKALPEEGKPADFCGAVGQFTLHATTDRTDLQAGEPVTLKVTLSGEGNIRGVSTPDLSTLEGFKVYESQASESSRARNARIFGDKVWEFVLVPTTGGVAEIPSIHLSTFDPKKQNYETLTAPAIPVTVKATALDDALSRGDGLDVAKERVRLRERDIRFVKSSPGSFRHAVGPIATRPSFLLQHAIPVLLFAGSVLMSRRRERLAKDIRWARSQKARSAAERRLRAAEKSLSGGDLSACYGEVSRALRGFVADKLDLAATNLEEETTRQELERRGATPDQLESYTALLNSCDGARYSPKGSDPATASEVTARARKWIAEVSRLAIWVVLIGALASGVHAAPTSLETSFDRGVKEYEEGKFDAAYQTFQELIAQGIDDPTVHYNLGNAAFKSGRLGEAIYFYRRAHALAPRDEDVIANLEYARFLALDATGDETRTDRRSEGWAQRIRPEEILRWAPWIFSLAAFVAIVSQLSRRLGPGARRIALALLVFWGITCAAGAGLAMWTAGDPEAVVLAKEAQVRNGPGTTFATAFVLHEGAEVVIEGERGEWIEISLPGDLHGWIEAKQVARL